MTDLQQALRASAEALGIDVVQLKKDGPLFVAVNYSIKGRLKWNPVENAEQDRLLLHWLLENGWSTNNNPDTDNKIWKFPEEDEDTEDPELFCFDCPANEFLTRATAAVWKESEK